MGLVDSSLDDAVGAVAVVDRVSNGMLLFVRRSMYVGMYMSVSVWLCRGSG